MTHDHHAHEGAQNIKLAFFLNLGFALAEVAGGLWTNSVTILSDALHDLGDSLTLGVSWYLDRYARKEESEEFSYGYQRFSLLGALLTGVILIVGSIVVLSEAIPRLMDPEPSNAQGMLLFALAGIAINGLAALRMRGGGNLNVQMVTWHLLEDVLGWVAVLLVSIVLLFWDLQLLDPILSILITLYVSYNVLRNLRKTLKLFLQSTPQGVSAKKIDEEIRSLPHVVDTHHTHIWSLDGENHVLTTHVVVDVSCDRDEVRDVKEAMKKMGDRLDMAHMTVEIEYSGDVCIMDGIEEATTGHEDAT
ncbi:MAG: cation diffusion facilitator family transporter [Anaerolineae bacterium]